MPRIDPDTAKPDQMPTARPRSSDGNTAVMVDRVPGMIMAAPTPMTARATMRTEAELAAAPTIEPVPNTTVPTNSTLRRPTRSPSAPIGSTSAASATVYASAIQVNCVAEAPMATATWGSTRFTPDTDPTTRTRARHMAKSTPVRRRLVIASGTLCLVVTKQIVSQSCF